MALHVGQPGRPRFRAAQAVPAPVVASVLAVAVVVASDGAEAGQEVGHEGDRWLALGFVEAWVLPARAASSLRWRWYVHPRLDSGNRLEFFRHVSISHGHKFAYVLEGPDDTELFDSL